MRACDSGVIFSVIKSIRQGSFSVKMVNKRVRCWTSLWSLVFTKAEDPHEALLPYNFVEYPRVTIASRQRRLIRPCTFTGIPVSISDINRLFEYSFEDSLLGKTGM